MEVAFVAISQSTKQAGRQASSRPTHQARDKLYLAMKGREVLVGGSKGPQVQGYSLSGELSEAGCCLERERELGNPGGKNSRLIGWKRCRWVGGSPWNRGDKLPPQ